MKVFLAGAESAGRPEILIGQKAKYVLCSYYYMRDRKDGGIERLKQYKDNGCTVFIDSGAHTFFSELGIQHGVVVTKQTKTKESYDEYFERYLDWLVKAKGTIDHFVELDIQEIVGQEKVGGWRKAMRDKGLDPIVVLHPKASPGGNIDAEWDRITSEFSYCAIEGSLPTGRYISWLTQSEKKNCRVHGFAMTKVDEMRRCKFYSVDSTSWIAGSRFGCTYYWKGGGRMDTFGPDDKKARVRFKYELENKAGIDWAKLEADDNTEIDKMNCYAWKQFGDWAETNLKCNYEKNVEGQGTVQVEKKEGTRVGEDPKGESKVESPKEGVTSTLSEAERRAGAEERRRVEEEVGLRPSTGEPGAPGAADSHIVAGEGGVSEDESQTGRKKLKDVTDTFEGNKGNIQEILRKNPEVEERRRKKLSVIKKGNIDALKHGRYASDPVIMCRSNCPKAESCPYWQHGAICYFDTRFRPIVERIQSTQPESIKEALAMLIRTQVPRLAKNLGFETLDGGYIDKNVTILADRLIQWTKDLHAITTPKSPSTQINVGGDLTIQKIENVVDRLPDAMAKKLGNVLAEIECIDTTGDVSEVEDVSEAEVIEAKEKKDTKVS